MKKILVILGILGACFGTENENTEFVEKVYNLEIKEDGSYVPKKRTWQDIEQNEWLEKYENENIKKEFLNNENSRIPKN